MNIEDMARRLYAAYETKDRQVVEAMLAKDFTFTSPLDDHIGRDAYFARCWPNSATTKTITVEEVFVQGQAAFIRYTAETTSGKVFRNTEWMRFDGDKLMEVDVYFGRTLKEAHEVVRPDEPINRPARDIASQLNAWAFD